MDTRQFNIHYILWYMSIILLCGMECRSDSGASRMDSGPISSWIINETFFAYYVNALLKFLTAFKHNAGFGPCCPEDAIKKLIMS